MAETCNRCGAVGGFGCYECTPETLQLYTRADLDAAVAAALREAAKSLDAIMRDDLDSSGDPDFDAGFTEGARCCLEEILSMIDPDAGAALDRALAAERERVADAVWEEYQDSIVNNWAFRKEHAQNAIAKAAAIRAQKENPDG